MMAFRFRFAPIASSHLRLISMRYLTILLSSRGSKFIEHGSRAVYVPRTSLVAIFVNFSSQKKEDSLTERAIFQDSPDSRSFIRKTQENDHKSCFLD